MNIQFRQGSEPLAEKLISRTERHLEKLAKRLDEQESEAQAYIAIEKESGSVHSENMWRTSITVTYGGDRWNASEQGSTPELATGRSLKDLTREITAARGRKLSLYRQGAGILKRLRRTGAY